ncbi:MAG: fumarylacetoacetate hydrolase family protein [Pseudomonadota bacterium]|nr:fumarylacetoacetate hydrolase family protein [Pseudomonadota bacterium]
MKLISYRDSKGESYGVATNGGVVNVGRTLKYPDLRTLLDADALQEVRDYVDGRATECVLDDITLLPPVQNPEKIIMVGLNYATHVAEGGRDTPQYPMLFPRYANTQVGHGQAMIRPKASEKLDFEGELAFVLGKAGRHVAKENAYDYVAGYACYNDGSIRDWQRHTGQFMPGKNFIGTGAFGPWLVTTDEIPDPEVMSLVTRLNGEEMQRATIDDLIFGVPDLIAYITTFTELVPGDVVVTGTTGGVGAYRTPPVWMKEGDTVEVVISGIGILRNPITNE